jgi:hypothetical protein
MLLPPYSLSTSLHVFNSFAQILRHVFPQTANRGVWHRPYTSTFLFRLAYACRKAEQVALAIKENVWIRCRGNTLHSERVGVVANALDAYSRSARFESRPGQQRHWLKIFSDFLNPSRQMRIVQRVFFLILFTDSRLCVSRRLVHCRLRGV